MRRGLSPYPAYKDSGIAWIGEVPKGWATLRLRFGCSIQGGHGFPERLQGREEGDFPFLKVSDINTGERVVSSAAYFVSVEDVEAQGWRLVREGSVLTGKIGEALRMNHRVLSGRSCLIDNNVMALTPRSTVFDTVYFWYLSKLVNMDWFCNPGTVPSVSNRLLADASLPIPPLPEQHAIVAFLDRETAKIDRLKDVRRRQIEVLREQRAAVIHHAVTQGLDPDAPKKDSGIPWLGEVPGHWEIKPLWAVARVRFSNVDKKSVDGEKGVLLCNYVDVYKNEFITNNMEFMAATAPEAQIRTFQLRVGDVLLTKDSEDWRDIAVPTLVVEAQERLLCGYHLAMLRPRPELAPGYLFRYFLTKFVRHYFAVRAAGVTRFGLSTDDIKRCPFPLPPRHEQEAIAAHIDRETAKIDALISKYERELELLDEYRASLISHVVTGKVDVRGLVNGDLAKT